jgi:hypothetical protein
MTRRKIAKTVIEIQAQIESETKLAKTIPPRKASENHISGSCVVSRSCMRFDAGVFAACIDGFHHSIELHG